MTKILAFSDVHLNLGCIRKLRAQEKNIFDAVVIAGDMGGVAMSEMISIVSTFECPVYYVYGNWDNQLGYEEKFGDQCSLLHLQVETVGGLFFAGFSGCPTHWGRNPVSLKFNKALQKKYAVLLKNIEEARNLAKFEFALIRKQHEDRIAQMEKAARGKSKWPFISALIPLEPKCERKEKAVMKNYESFMKSPEYKNYLNDALLTHRKIEHANRQQLIDAIKLLKVDVGRLVLVTHERMYRIHEEIGGLGFHLFGHRHGFKHTVFKGTNYVNVSVLDNVRSVIPKKQGMKLSKKSSEECFNVNAGNYCVIEIQQDGQNNIQCKELNIEEGWELLDYQMSDVWLPSEVQFL